MFYPTSTQQSLKSCSTTTELQLPCNKRSHFYGQRQEGGTRMALFSSLVQMLPENFQFSHTNILTGSQVRNSFAILVPTYKCTGSDMFSEVTVFYKLETGISRLPPLNTLMKLPPSVPSWQQVTAPTSRQLIQCFITRVETLVSYSVFCHTMCFIIWGTHIQRPPKWNAKGFVKL